ncbi:hypothetical protein BS50DRAFT_630065 [Corynespora cassiicola Philippines]|uniref:Uncharacterized protein n=1 Tax=Corynespora cassiicola Philippines TaxID=1448308 RepID=A0A2T2P2P4_CORCC|nr:hypothetical protein BS50DRAFT_630065 [Corynespora cassiicola Philippines]
MYFLVYIIAATMAFVKAAPAADSSDQSNDIAALDFVPRADSNDLSLVVKASLGGDHQHTGRFAGKELGDLIYKALDYLCYRGKVGKSCRQEEYVIPKVSRVNYLNGEFVDTGSLKIKVTGSYLPPGHDGLRELFLDHFRDIFREVSPAHCYSAEGANGKKAIMCNSPEKFHINIVGRQDTPHIWMELHSDVPVVKGPEVICKGSYSKMEAVFWHLAGRYSRIMGKNGKNAKVRPAQGCFDGAQ